MKVKFKKVYTVAQANQDPRVQEMFSEFGNLESGKLDWWINLEEGYICKSMECGTIHEQTVEQCLWLLNNDVVKVN